MVSSRLTRYRQTPGDAAKTFRGYDICTVDGPEPTNPHDGDLWLDTATSGTGGSGVLNVTSITGDTTLTISETVVLCDATAGAITVTLPAASGNTGRRFFIKKIDSSANSVTIEGSGSETIDDGMTAIVDSQYETLAIVCDGSMWHVI